MNAINYKEFQTTGSNLSSAVHTMDVYITSQISRCTELTADFIDALEYDALDRAQACVTFGGAL